MYCIHKFTSVCKIHNINATKYSDHKPQPSLGRCSRLGHMQRVIQMSAMNCVLYSLDSLLGIVTSFAKHRNQLDIVGTVYHLVIYMQSNKINSVILVSTFIQHLC